MDKTEIVAWWSQDQEENAARLLQLEEERERDNKVERQRQKREAQKRVEKEARLAEMEQRRLAELPKIIAANKAFHGLQLASLERIIGLTASEKLLGAFGGDLVNNDRQKSVVSTQRIPVGELAEGIEGEIAVMLFQTQYSHGLGKLIMSGKLWSEPEPRSFAVRLIGAGPGKYSEFAEFSSVKDLHYSKQIVNAPNEELGNLRWPKQDEMEEIQKISEILDFIDEQQSPWTLTSPL